MGKTNNYQIAGLTTITTTGNIDDLDVKGFGAVQMNNSGLSTIRGIKAGYPGQVVTFYSVGSAHVEFAHQNAGSAAANRLINFITSTPTPIASTFGCVTYVYDDGQSRWKMIDHNQGNPITIAYSSGNFTADVGTWGVDSGDQDTLTYFFFNRTCAVTISIVGSSVPGATTSALFIGLPFFIASSVSVLNRTGDNGVSYPGVFRAVISDNKIICYRDVNINFWSVSVNNTGVTGTITFGMN